MGVDVKTLGSVKPGALHGLDDGARDAARLGVGARDVVSVAGVAVAHDLGQNLGSARTGMLEFLKHDDACALAHHEAVAACVERTARRLGVGVLGQRFSIRETGHGFGYERSLGATGNDGVGVAVLDGAERLADRVCRGGTGGHHGQGGAIELLPDGDFAGCHVRDHHGDHEGRDAACAAGAHDVDIVGVGLHASDARTNVDAHVVAIAGALGVKTGLRDGFVGGDECVLDEEIHVARVASESLGAVEVLDLSGYLDLEVGRVESRDGADAVLSSDEGVPGLGGAVADGRDRAR